MSVPTPTEAAAERRRKYAESRFVRPSRTGVTIERFFTTPGIHPCDAIAWERREAAITNHRGEIIFSQSDVEVPEGWSQLATNVVVSKYFAGPGPDTPRETSVRQLIDRVAGTIARWGREGGYFATSEDAAAFEAELTHLTVNQYLAFNSPVWFNVGVEETPQCSACFINSIEDTMESILGLAKTEGMLFKYGSGTGTNLSPLRSSRETLSRGGTPSGPVSFMKGFDAFAGVIKSGGKTRRAAKMVILNVDHPDIEEFIDAKAREEQKAWALIDAGYDGSLDGEAYASVFFQNANHSVRVTDAFMHAWVNDEEYALRAVTTGETVARPRARALMRRMAEAAWLCGDPGIQYDTTINDWHTCGATDRIHASNPCSEYMFLNDSACNLASLNLMRFRTGEGEFETGAFIQAVGVALLAQEIIVDNARYPNDRIAETSFAFRPLGLGYANLGALLMSRGLAYDSEAGRNCAAAVTSLMHGAACLMSARLAAGHGPFEGYPENEAEMLRVIERHREAAGRIPDDGVPSGLGTIQREIWEQVAGQGARHGFRNAQVTVLAPTGTIAFMMDCDTTGIEPDIALVKYKKLVGGGLLKIVNRTVPLALASLGYDPETIAEIVAYIDEYDTIEGAPGLRDEHLAVFDCAFKPAGGVRSIHWMGHIRMMAAVQPFLSGAISKTVNLPHEATPEDIEKAYVEGWRLGLKALAVYRDGCKRTQPLNVVPGTARGEAPAGAPGAAAASIGDLGHPVRRRLPEERRALTHKFTVAGHEGYITVGMYEDGQPGEIFIVMAKEGSTISGLMDTVATMASMALQYGVPLEALVRKFSHMRFEPAGFTGNREIPIAKSIIDYVFRWLALKFLPAGDSGGDPADEIGLTRTEPAPGSGEAPAPDLVQSQADAPPCYNCGSIMVRSGSCYKCLNCGATSGCS